MSKRTKIILTVVIILIVLILAGLGIWYFFFQSKPASPSTTSSSPFGPGAGTATLPSGSQNPNSVSGSSGGNNLPSVIQNPLVELSATPVAGAGIYTSKTGSTTVRYVDRGTGHIYDINLVSGAVAQVSATTISPVYQAIWASTGQSVVLRYLASDGVTVKSYSATLGAPNFAATMSGSADSSIASSTTQTSASPGALMGSFLPDDIDAIAYSPAGTKIFYTNLINGREEGVTANTDGTKKLQIFDSPTSEWSLAWPATSETAVTTKPSYIAPGYLYFINATTGNKQKILGNINGLTDLVNPGATEIAYTDNTNNLSIYSVKSGQSIPTGLATLPEKCVWSQKNTSMLYCGVPTSVPAGNYPDDWYQGLVLFTDSIYKINATTGTTTLISNLSAQYGKDIDAINLALNKNEDHLIFMNKADYSLWGLAIGTSTTF